MVSEADINMEMKHLLIEGYCDGNKGEKEAPCEGTLVFGVYCLECSRFSYCKCPNEIAISNEEGLIETLEDFIGFGGEMEPEDIEKRDEYIAVWKDICRKKIKEAYDEYMSYFLKSRI